MIVVRMKLGTVSVLVRGVASAPWRAEWLPRFHRSGLLPSYSDLQAAAVKGERQGVERNLATAL